MQGDYQSYVSPYTWKAYNNLFEENEEEMS